MVVSNASPLIILSKLGLLHLLPDLFGDVRIAPEVFNEVVVAGDGRPASTAIQNATWIKVQPCTNTSLLQTWVQKYGMGSGELATILLVKEISANAVILDERASRLLATASGLKVIGCVGVLEIGHRKGLIRDLRNTYQQMLKQGVYITPQILNCSLASLKLSLI